MPNYFSKGDVLYGSKGSLAIHPILFLEVKDDDFFFGVMLSSRRIKNNIPLSSEYIVKKKNNIKFEFQFRNTHFVNVLLLKRSEWSPFRKIGEITSEGIYFVTENIDLENPMTWEEFLKQNQ